MFRCFLSIALVFGLQVVCCGAEKIYEGEPLKVLLVTGGGAHDYKSQAVILPEVMKARADFDVDVLGPDWKTVCEKLEGTLGRRIRSCRLQYLWRGIRGAFSKHCSRT